jgi:hypothetical protein
MLLYNEKNQAIDAVVLKAELKEDLKKTGVPVPRPRMRSNRN